MRLLFLLGFTFLTNQLNAFVFYEETRIWNRDSITFYFLDGTPQQQSEVKLFAKLWERYTGIKFIYVNEKPGFFNFKQFYTITFKGSSNQSSVGRVNGEIQFGELSDNIIQRKSTILHEFGHMLGLSHEHQRQDRPGFLNSAKILEQCKIQQAKSKIWCYNNILEQNFEEVFIESEYDIDSIMHYDLHTITGDEKYQDKNHSLSYTDKYYIAMLYNQNISDKTLEKMHKQDLWQQQKFESKAKEERENNIMKLSTSSCKPLAYPNKSKDGKYCESGFMIIGADGYSMADPEFKTCYFSLKQITQKIKQHPLCQLSKNQLDFKRKSWRDEFQSFGNCKRLDTNIRNNQEFYCTKGFSYVTQKNDLIGEKTKCYGSEESAYEAMKNDKICNLSKTEFNRYQRQQTIQQKRKSSTKYCQVVKKKYQKITCPKGFDYTIIEKDYTDEPINSKCFASTHQAINAMNKLSYCQ
jgi:hypothetical protein